jgi:hypothetical protein
MKSFIRETELLSKYIVLGDYYLQNNFNLRRTLEIYKSNTLLQFPDLQIVMMNPGSSFPYSFDFNSRKLVPASPDKTQFQLMRLMERCGFHYARVINLSDFVAPKSADFYRFLQTDAAVNFDHSIFSASRAQELSNTINSKTITIAAWGVNRALHGLACSALKALNTDLLFGIKKENHSYAYYHPLPRTHMKQLEWLDNLEKQLKRAVN